jgi:cobyrinic acid a,c-diamide synthase
MAFMPPESSEKKTDDFSAPRIAVARDEAFSFYYEDNLELLQECGAELVFFSPVHDREIPAADGLLLGGGYPELHAQALAQNGDMKKQIRECAAKGMPVLAECGGFMYLQENLVLEGSKKDSAPQSYQMCGVLPGTCRMTDRLVRFGYIELEKKDGESGEAGCLKDGHRIRGHEFHYFDSTDNGAACTARKPGGRRSWDCMVVRDNIMAGFPHLYYRSDPDFAASFVEKCRQFSRK